MKYLKLFEQFLILEAELKSSQFLQTEIEKTYNEAIEGLEEEQKERASKKGVLSKVKGWFTGNKEDDEVWVKFFEEEIEQPVEVISCKVNDVIYDRPKLQLGAVIFNKGLSTNFKYDKDFISLVNSVVTSKKMTEELKTIYDSSAINLAVNIFYKPKSNVSLKMGSIIKDMSKIAKDSITKANENFKFDLKILVTFSAGIGGMIVPLNNFVRGEFPNLTESNYLLITLASAMILITEHTENTKKLLSEISKQGLKKEFEKTIEVGGELKDAFLNFMDSLNLTFYKVTQIMGYAFLIPIIDLLLDLSKDNTIDNINEIVYRLILSLGTHYSAILMKEVITKIINRFRSEY